MQTDFKFFTTIHHSITSLKVQTSKLVEQVGINKFLYLANNNRKYIVSYEWLTTFTVVLYTFMYLDAVFTNYINISTTIQDKTELL